MVARITGADVIEAMIEVAEDGHALSMTVWRDRHLRPACDTICTLFPSWAAAWHAAGLKEPERPKSWQARQQRRARLDAIDIAVRDKTLTIRKLRPADVKRLEAAKRRRVYEPMAKTEQPEKVTA